MKVTDLMTALPESCRPDTNLAVAVQRLWDVDCGVLPVIDASGVLVGIITDRDICIALGTRDEPASRVRVDSVMRAPVETCVTSDDISTALHKMKDRRVRRLPVVDAGGGLVGVLSLNDIALAGTSRNGVRPEQLLETLRAIFAHRLPVPIADTRTAAV